MLTEIIQDESMTVLNYLILFCASLVLCSVGFKNFVYFMSVGYGFAIAGLAILLALLFPRSLTLASGVALLVFVLYGARLSGFLLYREFRNKNYKKVFNEASGSNGQMPVFVKIVIWIVCAVLYVLQVLPLAFRLTNAPTGEGLLWLGIVLSVLGLILESAADLEKSAQKKERADMVAMKGLYRFTRCPNYCGEILFWTGVLIGALNTLAGPLQWLLSILGYVSIVYVMISGAARLEKKQNKRYGDKKEYQEYVKRTPILLPIIPVYHLSKQEAKSDEVK